MWVYYINIRGSIFDSILDDYLNLYYINMLNSFL